MPTVKSSAVPWLLVVLSIVPLLGGAARLAVLAGLDGEHVPDRFDLDPLPVLLHIASASLYCLIGAFQFDDGRRRRRPARHRAAGRVAAACGLIAALSGVWMTLVYPIPESHQGTMLWVARLLVGLAMAGLLLLAVVAISRGDIHRHRASMMRAYALAQGAGTQVLLLLPPSLAFGLEVSGQPRDLLMVAAWLINIVVAERLIGRDSGPRRPVGAAPAA